MPRTKPDWPKLNELAKFVRDAIEADPQMKTNADRLSAFWLSALNEAWAAGYQGSLNTWKTFVQQGK